jgi:hypothetical protein
MAASNPTSPAMPTLSPHSPHTPMDIAMDIDSDAEVKIGVGKSTSPALPQLVTSFSSETGPQYPGKSTFSAMITTPRSAFAPVPWRFNNDSTCRRNSLTSPLMSPTQQSLAPVSPGHPFRTPERAFFPGARPANLEHSQDGRQSRMAMRSPGFGATLTLPLRVNTSLFNVPEEQISGEQPSMPSSTSSASTKSQSSSSTTLFDGAPAFATTNCSLSSLTNSSRRLVRSHTPAPITTQSPIRKRSKLPRLPAVAHLPPPPKYHMTVIPTLTPRSLRAKEQYMHSVEHLKAPLVPLISVTTGQAHPQFPINLLQYHLLTHEQLDSLARWYHQVAPAVEETFQYPAWIPAWTSLHPRRASTDLERGAETDLETKRRRWGRFIGLRGCETPVAQTDENGVPAQLETADELNRRMEREWRRALERAEEEARVFEKSWRGRW